MTSSSPGFPTNATAAVPNTELSLAPAAAVGMGDFGVNGPSTGAWAANGYDLQQQQQSHQAMAAAAQQNQLLAQQGHQQQLAPLVGQQIGSLLPNQQQGPTLNMMMQGMQPQAAGLAGPAGMMQSTAHQAHHLQSPPNSASVGQGLFFLPQQGAPRSMDHRDINPSPNATPGLQPPGPAQTPDQQAAAIGNIMELAAAQQQDNRTWQQQQQAANQNLLIGPARIGDKALEDMKMLNDPFMQSADVYTSERVAAQIAMVVQQQELARQFALAQHQQAPHQFIAPPPAAQSPPNHLTPLQMPPRPRPEGGQDPSPAFTPHEDGSLRQPGSKNDQLVIDSWSNEETEKVKTDADENVPVISDDGSKIGNFNVSGWGGPPPAHPSGWGVSSNDKPQHSQSGFHPGNWHQPPPAVATSHPQTEYHHRQLNNFQQQSHVGYGGKGGRGNQHYSSNNFDADRGGRGGYRGRGNRGGRGGARGGGYNAGPPLDHSHEKQEGKKSAIAETIAMMNKMKIEEKERKETHQKHIEAKRKEFGGSEADYKSVGPTAEDFPHEEPRRFKNHPDRGRGRGGRGMRGVRGGAGNFMPGNNGQMSHQSGGMFVPPPAMGIPPFPGIDGFMPTPPPGMPPFPSGPYGTGPAFFPMAPGMPGGSRYPRGAGRGGYSPMGFPPRGFPRGMPPMMRPRGGRGQRGSFRGNSRDKDQRSFNDREIDGQQVDEEDKILLDHATSQGEDEEKLEDPVNNTETRDGEADGKESTNESENGIADAEGAEASQDEQPKNLISGQGAKKGQLALSAKRQISRELDLRDRLTKQLVDGNLECFVCLDRIKQRNAVWDCSRCFQVFHIHCIKTWSRTDKTEEGNWRCPAGCGEEYKRVPREYRCFCRKAKDPEWNRRETPHSCGEVCGKKRGCTHECLDLCHPGPCSECTANINLICPCGKTKTKGRCGTFPNCAESCEKVLNCKIHSCTKPCHQGPCGDCEVEINQKCYCGTSNREVVCNEENALIREYCCGNLCPKLLDCSNHKCQAICHPGDCEVCKWKVGLVNKCPCGKTDLSKLYECDGVEERKSCLDPVPVCGLPCGKKLKCGSVGKSHLCEVLCHTGECPPCPLSTEVRCRCGFMDKELPCSELHSRADDARCDKRCNRKRSCGRHKCGQPCCIDIEHVCSLTCGRLLACGSHRCAEPCHKGNCQPCPNVSFDELYCECGAEVMFPPIACGTKPPRCLQPCRRQHPCSHEIQHNCHSDINCPPCTVLTSKWCHGKHELRKNIACHIEGISCGKPCQKKLRCSRHSCDKPCHENECLNDNESCKQPCEKKREICNHKCGTPCHEGDCPNTSCKEKISVKCQCGHLSAVRLCGDQSSEYKRLKMSAIMQHMQNSDGNAPISLVSSSGGSKSFLECNEECAQMERNRRLALALQIENPENGSSVSQRLSGPNYSEFMKDWVKRDPEFVQSVHEKLVNLVKLSKESKQKFRSFSFECMNRDKRQLVHEYCQHFGVQSEGADAEPKRNVIATAYRDRVFIPTLSVIEVCKKLRKAPGPVKLQPFRTLNGNPISSSFQTISKISTLSKINNGDSNLKSDSATRFDNKTVVDYFDD